MNLATVNKILKAHNLGAAQSFSKIEVGFTNAVYLVDDSYILKVCESDDNETPFRNEAKLYEYFAKRLPVPQIIHYDDTKELYTRDYLLYTKIHGDNLYNVWHLLSNEQRKDIVRQLCSMLKEISSSSIEDLPKDLHLDPIISWREHVIGKVDKYLRIVQNAGTLTDEQAKKVQEYIRTHAAALDDQRLALVYWDAHFDNVLVKDNQIVGLLDFERTELASIDFMLDIVKRMVDHPKKYMSEYAEQFARDEDYAQLLDWYREFYPELFEFDQLDTRLDIYTIAHNLEDLENWPHVNALKEQIFVIIRDA